MARVCIIKNGVVENVALYIEVPNSPPPGYDVSYIAVANDLAGPGWLWDGELFSNPSTPPPPVDRARGIAIVAQARIIISGEDISGIETAVGFAGAMNLDLGVYWIFFTVSQLDTDFGALLQANGDDGLVANVTDQTTDYVEVSVTNLPGVPANPTEIFLSIQRAR